MKQIGIELLLKDLCTRLSYEVMCNIGLNFPLPLQQIFIDEVDGILLDFYKDGKNYQVYLSEVKPYLRPMSSMTEEEIEEYKHLLNKYTASNPTSAISMIDWLNAHHFDYRGLIEKGLALPAPEGMYKFK